MYSNGNFPEQMASERTCAMLRDPTTSGLMMLCQVIKTEQVKGNSMGGTVWALFDLCSSC